MKKMRAIIVLVAVLLMISACATDDNVVESPTGNQEEDNVVMDESEESADTGDETGDGTDNGMDPETYAFTHFELEVEYANDQEIDIDYENESDGMEAKYENDFEGIDLRGDEAMQELDPYFSQLTFDQSTPDNEVIEQVISVFNLEPDYEEFELEVTFEDGTKKAYKS
ncbi:YusW family protein [Bacillus sp. FJAT-45037]|uniref:YusW family protein n=1 Tax=Bacillus sp. FJAT-45037 TaxID=2011007 RepID=UPI0012FD942B|nr:YusW family protein [Bacillus sp. FJAT-45037]